MSIAPARKVSSSSVTSRVERKTGVSSQSDPFVEVIDTNNNILVRDEPERDTAEQHPKRSRPEPREAAPISPSSAYVSNSLEALAVSGVFEETPPDGNTRKVGIYDTNQAIIRDEELDRTGRSYLKHFYEKNEHIKEIDELI